MADFTAGGLSFPIMFLLMFLSGNRISQQRFVFFITVIKLAPSVFSKAVGKKSFFFIYSVYVFLPGLQEVVVVIQSQRNSYHARRSEQRKVELLQQAAEEGKVNATVRGIRGPSPNAAESGSPLAPLSDV